MPGFARTDAIFKKLSPKQEVEFRKWARDNYKVNEPIDPLWHPVIRDECEKMNANTQKLLVTELYHYVERPLSQALQPDASISTSRCLVSDARGKLREVMRAMGWQGPF